MRGSRVKKIRKQVDRFIETGIIKSDEVDLKESKTTYVKQGRTVILGDCKRRLYQIVKKTYKTHKTI